MPQTIVNALKAACQQLSTVSDSANLDAQLLLSEILQVNSAYLYTWPEKILSPAQKQTFDQWVAQRLTGKPIAYIIGYKRFWDLDIAVNEHTLIPRPETELLIELCLADLPQTTQHILDLGTGSGAIALVLARERPDWHIVATDKSPLALQQARQNAQRLGIKNITFILSDWFAQIPAQASFAAIISNPPYIDNTDRHLEDPTLQFEPRSALVAPKQGLGDLERIITQAPAYLNPHGRLYLEHGHDQSEAVSARLKYNGFKEIKKHKDLAANWRVITGKIK